MPHKASKTGVGSVSKGFSPEEHNFLKVSIPLWSILRLDMTWPLFQSERVIMAVSVWGAEGEKAEMGTGGGQGSCGFT